jgi:hypothetical protein
MASGTARWVVHGVLSVALTVGVFGQPPQPAIDP